MRNLTGTLLIIFLIITVGFSQKVQVITLDIDRSSMPEGIAIHPQTGEIYAGSIRLNKITRSDPDGQNTVDIIEAGVGGFTFTTGLMIGKNFLFACGKHHRGVRPIVLQINLDNHEIVNTFLLPPGDSAFFNDLTLDQDLNAYFTDSGTGKIYRLNYATEEISFFMQDENLTGPNGITISPDQSKLYVNSNKDGIRVIDIASKKIINPPHRDSMDKGVDGLLIHDGWLYAVYNYGGKMPEKHGLVRFRLSEDGSDLGPEDPMVINHPRQAVPTTVDIHDGYAYYIANSQFSNFNWGDNSVKDPGVLTDTYVLKVKINP